MTISLSGSETRRPRAADPQASCALHTYLTLPSGIFADKYQLSSTDEQFLQSHHLGGLRAVSGETDLEAPDWAVDKWGSSWLLELAIPEKEKKGEEFNITIPLHLRYQEPSQSGYRSISLPWPVVFWACTAEQGTLMAAANPFDRVNLGWEGLFGPRTMFYQVSPSSESSTVVETIRVPVLKVDGDATTKRIVEVGTVAVILAGTLWVLMKLGMLKGQKPVNNKQRRRKERRRREES